MVMLRVVSSATRRTAVRVAGRRQMSQLKYHSDVGHFIDASPVAEKVFAIRHDDGLYSYWHDEAEKWFKYTLMVLPFVPVAWGLITLSDAVIPHKVPEPKKYPHFK